MKLNQKGFSNPWEIIVIVIFVAVLFIVGIYAWQVYQKNKISDGEIPQAVIDQFNKHKGFNPTMEYCINGRDSLYVVYYINLNGEVSFFDGSGKKLETFYYSDIILDNKIPQPKTDTSEYTCKIIMTDMPGQIKAIYGKKQ